MASIKLSGSAGTPKWSGDGTSGVRSIRYANSSGALSIKTHALLGTGVPATGATTHELPVRIEIPNGTDTLIVETTVELSRRNSTAGRWSR
jgi:hypothetical protein